MASITCLLAGVLAAEVILWLVPHGELFTAAYFGVSLICGAISAGVASTIALLRNERAKMIPVLVLSFLALFLGWFGVEFAIGVVRGLIGLGG